MAVQGTPFWIPTEYLHTTTRGARPQTRTSKRARCVTWGYALSFPSAACGNVIQVAEEVAWLQQWGSIRTLGPEGDSSSGSSSWYAIGMFVHVHRVRLMPVPLCNAVAG